MKHKNESLKLVLLYGGLLALAVYISIKVMPIEKRATTPAEEQEYATQDSIKFSNIKADMQRVPFDTLHFKK